MSETIGLVRTPIGNLQSAYNAFYELGFDPVWVDREFEDYEALSHLVVPGVGHFAAVMANLVESGLAENIVKFAHTGKPVMGICVGMQILATLGTEGSQTQGLGLIKGRVDRLSTDPKVRLPHVGWNTVEFRNKHPVIEGIKEGRDFYFVHTYGMTVDDDKYALGYTNYGRKFASIVANNNVIGCQFHPEKSQVNGMKILENFCFWDGSC